MGIMCRIPLLLLLLLGCSLSISNAYTTTSSIKSPLWRKRATSSSNEQSTVWSRTRTGGAQEPNQASAIHHQQAAVTSLRAGASDTVENSSSDGKTLTRELLAEFIGTFIIVQLGTGSVMSDIFDGAFAGLFQIASVWIIAVTLAISTTAHISGAHLNPSISVALALFRDFEWKKVIPYSVAQTLGAAAASAVNFVLFASKIKAFESANGIVRGTAASVASARAFGEYFADPVTTATAFFAEAFGTAVLAFVVFSLTNPRNDCQKNKIFIPPLIGATVGALIAVIAPLTQAGFNPARDFGPRIVAWMAGWKGVAFTKWWVYVLAPLVGAPIGAILAEKLHAEE